MYELLKSFLYILIFIQYYSCFITFYKCLLFSFSYSETLLANEVFHWIKLPHYYKHQIDYQQGDKFEITKIRIPRGVIILKEKDKVTLFRELTQCLIAGNSVIVVCNPDLCTLVQYCDIFSTATIPLGVINLISSNIIEDMKYEKILESPQLVYIHLTITKHIILSLK